MTTLSDTARGTRSTSAIPICRRSIASTLHLCVGRSRIRRTTHRTTARRTTRRTRKGRGRIVRPRRSVPTPSGCRSARRTAAASGARSPGGIWPLSSCSTRGCGPVPAARRVRRTTAHGRSGPDTARRRPGRLARGSDRGSVARWKLVGQQVMVANVTVSPGMWS